MKRIAALFALLALAAPAGVSAQDYGRPALGAGMGEQDQAREAVRSGRQAPLSRVLAMIGQRTPRVNGTPQRPHACTSLALS